jgi:hypothetical protein
MVSNISGKTLLRKAPIKAPAMAVFCWLKIIIIEHNEKLRVSDTWYGATKQNEQHPCSKVSKLTPLTQWFHDENQVPIHQWSIGQWMSLFDIENGAVEREEKKNISG